jgi:para-aminobenzoate synthetase component I
MTEFSRSMAHVLRSSETIDLTPVEVAARCRHLSGFVFFDSAIDGAESISIVAAMPREVVAGKSPADWQTLRERVRAAQRRHEIDRGLPCGIAAGWVGYDGSFCFGFYDDTLVCRHCDQSWHVSGENLISNVRAPSAVAAHECKPPRFAPGISREHFCGMVRTAQDYIAAGDIYQVNLSHRFSSPWSGDHWKFYESLRHYSPAPHAACIELGGRAVLSSSPELFLRMSGRHILTRPIKGTRPRRADSTADQKSAYDLLTSPKEIAELVMITDLERNDLGKICEYGSVSVSELVKLERYEQVFHLVSTVEGELRAEIDHVAALESCFPGGSITGAPKKRAREIIAELEPEPRGLYTGAIGYFGFNGESQFNIAIRTVVIENSLAHFHVGAGIVADSIPEKEYEETLDKAAGILLAAARM